jgi:murein DD-endopeptidase MepM/ murein hydrolase activator NlpD
MVSAGDTVQRGQAIAVVGSTGRSTGPHVHFEVLKDGRQIDPMAFIGH